MPHQSNSSNKLQTGQVILPSSPVPAPARGKDSSHHAAEFIFNPGPCDNRKRGRMTNLITGTSTEDSWLHITQVGAASLLLSTQTQDLTCLLWAGCNPPAPFKSCHTLVTLVPPAQLPDPLPSQSHVCECWASFGASWRSQNILL